MIFKCRVESSKKGMFMVLRGLFKKDKVDDVKSLSVHYYQMAVDRARDRKFYENLTINDDPLGRFEMLALHLFIMLRRLKEEKGSSATAHELSQELCDLFVADMDHCLRDLRLSELKIDKQFKVFVEGFYGRLAAYDDALERAENEDSGSKDHHTSKLLEALLKNIYNGCKTNEGCAIALEKYIHFQLANMRGYKLFDLQFKIGDLT